MVDGEKIAAASNKSICFRQLDNGNQNYKKVITVQPSIYYIHKSAGKMSVAATQLMFTSCNK